MNIASYLDILHSCPDERLDEFGISGSNWSIVTSASYDPLIDLILQKTPWNILSRGEEESALIHPLFPVSLHMMNWSLMDTFLYQRRKDFVDPRIASQLKSSIMFHGYDQESVFSQPRSVVLALAEFNVLFQKNNISFFLHESVPYEGDLSKLVNYVSKTDSRHR